MTRRISRKHRFWASGLAVLALMAATTVPGSAAPTGTKYYMASVTTSSPVTAGAQNQVFTVTIKNTSPKQSSSNIGSVSVSVPDEFAVVSAAIDPSSTNGDNSTATVTTGSGGTFCQQGTSQQVNACGIAQVKSQKTIVLAITANVGADNLACGSSSSGSWGFRVNTGTQLNGDEFSPDPEQTTVTTQISKTCPLDWKVSPADGTVGAGQSVTVAAYTAPGGSVDTAFTGAMTVQVRTKPSSSTLSITPSATQNAVAGEATFTLTGNTAGSYTVYATASGKSDAPDKTFTLVATDSAITGQVWRDHDNDGTKDTDEAGQSGWKVMAFDGSTAAGTATTDSTGNYSIGSLVSGTTYTVCEFAPNEASGFEYRGWLQSVPGTGTSCTGFASQAPSGFYVLPNGRSVTIPGPGTNTVADRDFLNVRTITIDPDTSTVEVDCANLPPGGVFRVGDGITEPKASVTVDPDACKPGVYVFETWVSSGEQTAQFYPTFTATTKVPLTEQYEWVIEGDRTQQTLYYDDDGAGGVPEREMLFCEVDGNGDFAAFPDPVAPDDDPHTSCLLNTTEDPTATGVQRFDTVYTLIDGVRKLSS